MKFPLSAPSVIDLVGHKRSQAISPPQIQNKLSSATWLDPSETLCQFFFFFFFCLAAGSVLISSSYFRSEGSSAHLLNSLTLNAHLSSSHLSTNEDLIWQRHNPLLTAHVGPQKCVCHFNDFHSSDFITTNSFHQLYRVIPDRKGL